MPFRFLKTEIPGVILVELQSFHDHRGTFTEWYKQSEFQAHGIAGNFVYGAHSRSTRGVLRGLHYQMHPRAQAKLVGAIRGKIFCVAVDLRAGSPAFGRWFGVELSEERPRILYVPVGFAHGFCAMSDEADVVFKMTEEYAPEHERGVLWNDPDIGIRWPIERPLLSAKDAALPPLRRADCVRDPI